jgi:hypothetical protein
VWQVAGTGGQIADTIVRVGDDETLTDFEALFTGP